MTFKPDQTFNSSHKMGDAKITFAKAIAKFGTGNDESDGDGKVENSWSGTFTANDGTVHRASFWNWKKGLNYGAGVSVWISNEKYLPEFTRYIEA
jgi:hypothetical protein